jgi:hypothetical protein
MKFPLSVCLEWIEVRKKGDVFEERRILLEENEEKRHEENFSLATLRGSVRNLVFGPWKCSAIRAKKS